MESPPPELDAAAKRRLQNRLNQRASRQRKASKLGKRSDNHIKRWVVYTNNLPSPPEEHNHDESPPVTKTDQQETPIIDQNNYISQSYNTPVSDNLFLTQIRRKIADGTIYDLIGPCLQIPVIQYNMLRALMINAAHLGLTIEILQEDIASQFNIPGPQEPLPPSLQPTYAQKSIIHHPWIDLLPIVPLRESLLLNYGCYDEDELCIDAHGFDGCSDWQVGMMIWGEPLDPAAYELSKTFVKKWAWLLRSYPGVLDSTNYWRRMRGEEPLQFPKLGDNRDRIEEIQ